MVLALGIFLALIAVIGFAIIELGVKRAEDDPPKFGLVVNIFKGYTKRTVKPGSMIVIWPVLDKVIFESATIEDVDIVVEAVSKDNIDMIAVLKISYKPDYERKENFIDRYFLSGGRKKINERLAALAKAVVRRYINQHNAKKCEKSPVQASEDLIDNMTTLPRDEAMAKIQKGDEGIPDIEGVGTIITRISVVSIVIADPEIRKAREATTKEMMLRQARIARTRTFNRTVEERNKVLEGKKLTGEEKRKHEQEYTEERNWDLAESGHGQVIITPQTQRANVIVDGRSEKKR